MGRDGVMLSSLAEKVHAGDRDRFESALFAPEEDRERLFALYAFNLELARAPWATNEPQLAAMRLRWWRDVIAAAYEQAAPRAHEVAEPLHELIQHTSLPRRWFEEMVDARLHDIEVAPFAEWSGLEAYLDATAGNLMRLAARILAPEARKEMDDVAGALGVSHGAARLLTATPALAAAGRTLLPLPPEARLRLFEGESSQGLRRAANRLAAIGRAHLWQARSERRAAPKRATPALLAAWRAPRILAIASGRRVDPLRDLAGESEFRRRLSLLWRGGMGQW